MSELTDVHYQQWLGELKQTIQNSQQSATLAVNKSLLKLYWQLGKSILQQQKEQGWGAKVIEQVAKDLKQAFPHLKGFSRANLMYMRAFAEAWPSFADDSIVQQAVGQLTENRPLINGTRPHKTKGFAQVFLCSVTSIMSPLASFPRRRASTKRLAA